MNKIIRLIINTRILRKREISGMTLIEVIVSIAILGIIAIGFLPMFSTGIKLIVNNEKQINGMYINQNSLEQKIAQGTISEAVTLNIEFPSKTIEITGEDMTFGSFNLFISKK